MRPQITGSILMAKSPTGNTEDGTARNGRETAPIPAAKAPPGLSGEPRLPATARESRDLAGPADDRGLVSRLDARDYVLEANYLAELYAETLYDEAVAGLDAALADPSAANPVHAGFGAFLPGLMEAYGNAARQWLDGAPDDAARGELAAVLARIVGRLRIQAVAHEHAVRLRWRVETAEALLAGKLAAAKAAPGMAEVIRDAGDVVIDRMAALGAEAGAADARRARFHADIAKIAVEALIEADPAGALRRLEAGDLDGLIGDAGDGSGGNLKAGLRAYAEEAAEVHAADTDWLVEKGRMDAEMTRFRRELEAGLRHRRAIAAGAGSFASIEFDRQSGLIPGAEADRLSKELRGARAAARDRARTVRETSDKIRRAIVMDAPVPAKDRGADWRAGVDAFYEDMYRHVIVTRPELDDQIAASVRLAKAAGVIPSRQAGDMVRAVNSGAPGRMVVTAKLLDAFMADDDLKEALARQLPQDILVELLAIRPDADGMEAAGYTPETIIQRSHARLQRAVDRRERSRIKRDRRERAQARTSPPENSPDLRGRLAAVGQSSPVQRLAAAGRGGDTAVGHVPPGAVILPPRLRTPAVAAVLRDAFRDRGLEMGPLTVGGGDDAMHPETGAPDFDPDDAAAGTKPKAKPKDGETKK